MPAALAVDPECRDDEWLPWRQTNDRLQSEDRMQILTHHLRGGGLRRQPKCHENGLNRYEWEGRITEGLALLRRGLLVGEEEDEVVVVHRNSENTTLFITCQQGFKINMEPNLDDLHRLVVEGLVLVVEVGQVYFLGELLRMVER